MAHPGKSDVARMEGTYREQVAEEAKMYSEKNSITKAFV